MSAIFTPEVATLVGCVDSDAFTDGAPVSSHVLRPMARSANRLKSKAQPLFNLVWPTTTYTDLSTTLASGVAPTRWTRIMSPVPVKKRPGLMFADCWLRANIASGIKIEVVIASRARPFVPGQAPHYTMTGTGAFANYTVPDVPLAIGDSDELELWFRAFALGSLMNTGTYGTPADSTAIGSVISIDYNRAAIAVTGAAWNTSAAGALNSPAMGGHVIVFYDDNGAAITAPRDIVANGSTRIEFAPPLSSHEAHLVAGSQEFKIFGATAFGLCNFGAMALENTDQRLIPPYSYHPATAVTGECLGQVLEVSTDHLARQSRVIGYQTYPVLNLISVPALSASEAIITTASTWIDLAWFPDVHIPQNARRVMAALYYKRANTEPAIVHLRVIADNAGSLDTGTEALDPPSGSYDPATAEVFEHQVHTQWAPGDPGCGVVICTADLTNARVSSGSAARTFTVQGYCSGTSVSQSLQPSLVMAWWEE